MNHRLMEVREKHLLWAVRNIFVFPWAIWYWVFPEAGFGLDSPGTSWTTFTDARISDFGFGNSAVCCGGRGEQGEGEFVVRDWKLNDFKQISTNCWLCFRDRRMVCLTMPPNLSRFSDLLTMLTLFSRCQHHVNTSVQINLYLAESCQFPKRRHPILCEQEGQKCLIMMKEKSCCCLNLSVWEPDLLSTFAKPDLELHRSLL